MRYLKLWTMLQLTDVQLTWRKPPAQERKKEELQPEQRKQRAGKRNNLHGFDKILTLVYNFTQ